LAKQTPPGSVTVAAARYDRQLTLETAISAVGDSIRPLSMTTNKTFEEKLLLSQQTYHGQDYVMKNVKKMLITSVLLVDWLQTEFTPKNDELQRKDNDAGSSSRSWMQGDNGLSSSSCWRIPHTSVSPWKEKRSRCIREFRPFIKQ
jgi:hypothetical protein